MEDSYITRSQVFHFVDCFAKSFGIQDFIFNDSLENIGAAKDILQQYHLSAKQYTCFQLCTSDTKKELSAQQNIDLLEHFMNINTDTQVVVLCAPNEVDKLKYIVDYFESGHNGDNHNSNLSLISCTFAEAYALLKNAKGLFSLDTSIKHLAANIATPIVELAIGSSNPYETAAYSENNLVLQANLACHPCSHSSACSKQSHECALNLDIKSVAEISTAYFNQNKKEMQSIASRSASTMHSYMTQFDFYQNLSFIPLAAHLVDSFILKEIEKISIQYLLNDKQNKNFSITEQISFIYEQSRALAGDLKLRSFRAKLEEYLNDMMLLETSSLRLLDSIEESKSLALETSMHDWWSGLNLDTVSVKGIWSTRLSDIKIEQNSFKRFRRLHNLVKDVSQSLGFKKKAIRTLLSEMESVVL